MELGELYICRRSVAYDMRLLLKLTFVLVLEAMKALEFRLTFLDEIYKVHDIKKKERKTPFPNDRCDKRRFMEGRGDRLR